MKRRLSVVLAVLVLALAAIFVLPNPVQAATVASGKCGDNVYWSLDDQGTLTISGTGPMWDYGYDANGFPVYTPWKGREESVKALVIEEGVTYVGEWSFEFFNNLVSVTVPSTLTEFGGGAFVRCESLTEVYIVDLLAWINTRENDWDSTPLGANELDKKLYLNGTLFTDLVIPEGFSGGEIRGSAFIYCANIQKVTLPDSWTEGLSLFRYCNNLKGYYVSDTHPMFSSDGNGALLSKDGTQLLAAPAGISGKYVVPSGVVQIGYGAFEGCEKLEEVILPAGLEIIDHYAFDGCASLTNVKIPDTVTFVGQGAFRYCKSLTEMVIPEGVTELDGTFLHCENLVSVKLPESLITLSYTFESCYSLKNVNIPNNVTAIGNNTFLDCRSLTAVDIPDKVTSIGKYAFLGCVKLESVKLPSSLTDMGEEAAFQSCISLKEIVIPEGVTDIGPGTFALCSSLRTVYFRGDAPSRMFNDCFEDVTATAYYPGNNSTWTSNVMKPYGGNITWRPYDLPKQGWEQENGKWVYYSDDVKLKSQWLQVDSYWYHLDANGYMECNTWIRSGSKWCYLDANGHMVTNQWQKIGSYWYHFDGSGYMESSKWIQSGSKWCYLDGSGHMTTNQWVKISGYWYHFDSNGYMESGKWVQSGGKWCYLNSNGRMVTNQWQAIGADWYHFDSNGYMESGKWVQSGGKWCYLGGNGRMASNEWQKVGTNWYHFNDSGHMEINAWINSNGKWYYVNGSGHMLTSQWLLLGGKYYYVDANGVMVTGTQAIGGKTYIFNSSGVWIG